MINGAKIRARLLGDGARQAMVDIFFAYHKERPHIWEAFERLAIAQAGSGATRLSNKSIGEKLREDPMLANLGEFKVSNTFLSYYARVFDEKYPIWGQLFEFKPLEGKNDERLQTEHTTTEVRKDRAATDQLHPAQGRQLGLHQRTSG